MKKRILSWLLCAALLAGLIPAAALPALADDLSGVVTLSDDYISVSVSKANGGFTIRTVEGDRLKKSDNDKNLLYHDGRYDTSFVSFQVGSKEYLFGGKYPGSTLAVTEENSTVKAVWTVDGLTFTQSISLTNTSSNESGMVGISLSVANATGAAVPVKARILYDTALGGQDFGYYQCSGATIERELVLDGAANIPAQLYAVDDPYSPSVAAYSVSSGTVKPYRAAFGHWSHLASTLFDFDPIDTLYFTNTRSEYMTADSAYALYYDLGSVAAGGEAALSTYYGVFSNHAVPASDSVAVNLTAPVRLTLTPDKTDFVPESGVKGQADFSVTVDFANVAAEGAQDLENIALVVRTSGGLRLLDDNGENGPAFGTAAEPIRYTGLSVGETKNKTLYFEAKPGTDAAYERITVGVYALDANGQIAEDKKLGERMAYVLLPGSDNDVPKVSFAAMTPKIIYTEGTRHLFVTVTNETMLASTGNWALMAYSEDGRASVPIPHESITIKDGVMDVALTDDIRLAEGGWYLQLEWTDAAVSAGVVPARDQFQTAPELHFTVSADKKYKNDSYGILAVIERSRGDYILKSFRSEEEYNSYAEDTDQYEEILLTFKGEFTKKMVDVQLGQNQVVQREHYIAASTKTLVNGKYEVDNPIVINGCMDFEGGSLEIYCDKAGDICTEFDGELYTNTERTSIWKGKAIFTKIEQGKSYSLIPYNENGERGSYEDAGNGNRKLNTDAPQNFTDKPISLIWPSAAGIGQTLSGMIFKMAYAQLGVMYDTENQTNKIEDTIGCVVSFTAALDLTFASGKVDPNRVEEPTYWSELRQLWSSYNDLNNSSSLYNYVYNSGRFEQALDWSDINEDGGEDNEKHVKGSVMVRDVLFGCGEGFLGVNFEVGVAIKNYISGLPEIEGTISVSTINNWAFGVEGEIKLATFTVEAKVSFKSKNNIPIPDELYVFVSGFEPGLNIDGCGVLWITGAGGGIKNIYDTIFMTQAVPPLKLALSVSFDVVKVLTCQKATLSLGLTGISLQAEGIGIKKIESLTAIQRMGLSLEWYPGIDLRANIVVDLFQHCIYGAGYIVLISPDYHDVFFEMFARAELRVPSSVPVVGGMKLAGIDLGINSEKIWGALEVLFITLGVTYYWGEGSVDFGSGSKSNPTFPDLLGYDDVPVCYDAENDRTLYARVGTNTQIMASSLPNDGLTLMATGASLHCRDVGNKTRYVFNLGSRASSGDDAIIQISFDAASEAEAQRLAGLIKVGTTDGGDNYGRVLYTQVLDEDGNLLSSNRDTANANLNWADGKATYAFTATQDKQYGKDWYLTGLPQGSDVILYNVAEVPEVTEVSGTPNNSGGLDLTWDGAGLADLDQISFYLCGSNDPKNTDPGCRIGMVESGFDSKSASLTIPADVPSGDYYIRAVYSKSDEVNGAVFSTHTVHWVNTNTPGAANFTPTAAGNLQYQLTIPYDANTDGYLVTIYNADGTATDFENVSYEAAASGDTVINVGGSYQAADPEDSSRVKTFGLTGGRTYTIGVTPYHAVTSGGGETAVYGKEVTKECALPEMKTPTVTFSADQVPKSRTETIYGKEDEQGNRPVVETTVKDVYLVNSFTLTAAVSEAVTGTWRLDNSETVNTFDTLTDRISIPLADLTEGEHTVTIQGAAADGDSFAATYTFMVDTLPPQLLLSSPVNGSFFGRDGKLTVSGVTDADACFTIIGVKDCGGKTIDELGGTFDPATGAFSFTVEIPDYNSASQHTVTISVADDVGNATPEQTVEVSHGGLADLVSLEIMVDGRTYDFGNIPVPAAGLNGAALTLVGVTSEGTRFNLTGYNVNWEVLTVEGTASLYDGKLTAAAGSQGIVTGKLAVASGAYRTATLCFGAPADHTVSVSATIGGSVTGGGQYAPGSSVTLTAIPDSGYRFAGWTIVGASVADTSAASVTFTMPDTGNVTALAAFEPAAAQTGRYASAGQLVRVKVPSSQLPYYRDTDGNKVFVPISAEVDGWLTFIAPVTSRYYFGANPVAFTDIAGRWFEDNVLFNAQRQIFKGIGGGVFAPDSPTERAMLVTVLYRMSGSPAVSGGSPYTDVRDGSWYADAARWAWETGIARGYGDGRFGPGDHISREQMCAMIVRWLACMGYDLPAVKEARSFTDESDISTWAKEAVAVCQTRGIVSGVPGGAFAPGNDASRAETCAVIERLIRAVLGSQSN